MQSGDFEAAAGIPQLRGLGRLQPLVQQLFHVAAQLSALGRDDTGHRIHLFGYPALHRLIVVQGGVQIFVELLDRVPICSAQSLPAGYLQYIRVLAAAVANLGQHLFQHIETGRFVLKCHRHKGHPAPALALILCQNIARATDRIEVTASVGQLMGENHRGVPGIREGGCRHLRAHGVGQRRIDQIQHGPDIFVGAVGLDPDRIPRAFGPAAVQAANQLFIVAALHAGARQCGVHRPAGPADQLRGRRGRAIQVALQGLR